MTEKAPERIWAWHIRDQDGKWLGKHAVQDAKPNHPEATEYLRADLIKELESAIEWQIGRAEAAEAKLEIITERSDATEKANEELGVKLAKAVDALGAFKDFDDMPTSHKRPDVFELRVRRNQLATLAELKGEK